MGIRSESMPNFVAARKVRGLFPRKPTSPALERLKSRSAAIRRSRTKQNKVDRSADDSDEYVEQSVAT